MNAATAATTVTVEVGADPAAKAAQGHKAVSGALSKSYLEWEAVRTPLLPANPASTMADRTDCGFRGPGRRHRWRC
jgi:hypothetical protein